jgi:hypothetical protein
MKLSKKIHSMSFITGLVLLRCSLEPMNVAGGASGTDLSACVVSGNVVDSSGNPVAGAVVYLRQAGFLAADSEIIRVSPNGKWIACDTLTDASGSFHFKSIDTGSYSIEVNYKDSLGILFPCTVSTHDARNDLPQDTLYPLAVVTGHIDADANPFEQTQVSVIQVYGLQRIVRPDSAGFFRLLLPQGQHNLRFSSDSGNIDPMEVSIYVHPNQQKDIGHFHLGNFPWIQRPCQNLECDLSVVRSILDSCGLFTVAAESVVTSDSGRVAGLNLQGRNIVRIPMELGRLERLRTLDLSGNAITNLPPPRVLPSALRTMVLRANKLTELPGYIGLLRNIETLDLSNNQLQSLPDSIVTIAPLVMLDLSGNKLCSLPSSIAAWADRYDSDWRQTQDCNGVQTPRRF